MKKKILCLGIVVLLLITLFVLTGCSNDYKNENTNAITNNNTKENEAETSKQEEKNKLVARRDMSDYDTLYWGFVYADNYFEDEAKWVIEPKYKKANDFSDNGLALVQLADSGKFGYINSNNEFKLEPIYNEAQTFSNEGYAGVVTDDKVGIINSQGEFVCTFENVWYAAFCEETNLVKVVKDKFTDRVYAFYDLNGNPITEYKYWETNIGGIVTSCNNGYIEICDKETKLYGLLDKTGKEIVECKYKTMLYYSDEELWLVTDDSAKYFINEKGEKVKDW